MNEDHRPDQPLLPQEALANGRGNLGDTDFPPPTKVRGVNPFLTKADLAVCALLPWLIFAMVLCLFLFSYEDYSFLVWALVAVSLLMTLLFLAMGASAGRSGLLALGFLSLVAIITSVCIGLFIFHQYLKEYYWVESGAVYDNVSPAASGKDHQDATILRFAEGSFVDTQRTVGYMEAGVVYCVAPVLSKRFSNAPQYWAVGLDCCDQRNNFRCGDVDDGSAKNGIGEAQHTKQYSTAVRMAEAVYEMNAEQSSKVLVRWTKDPDAAKEELWSNAIDVAVTAIGLYLIASIAAAFILKMARAPPVYIK